MTDTSTSAVVRSSTASPNDLQTLDGLQRWSKVFVSSGFFNSGGSIEQQMAQAIVKVQYGREVGLAPIQALMGIEVIEGKPSLKPVVLAALIRKSEHYDYRVTEHTSEACTVVILRDGEEIGTSRFTMEDAKNAGLAGKNNWKRYGKSMLLWRALGNAAKWYCPDLFMGPVYTGDELEEYSPEPNTELPNFPRGEIVVDNSQPTPPWTDTERKQFHAIGRKLYGELWNAKRHELVEHITKGRYESSADLTRPQFLYILNELVRRNEEGSMEQVAEESGIKELAA